MEISVLWKEGKSFIGNSTNGFKVDIDAKKEVGGNGQGFLPMELIANGIAGCTAIDVISILQKKRQKIVSFEVKIHAKRLDTHPKEFSHILIEYLVSGVELDPIAVERAVQISEEKYCPAIAMFRKVCPVEHKISILS
ncbi:MAG: OsmC family protein [Anaerolineaceae bacterium]|jgi:putative redox protein|nr:OsmC family protein [Anaerolineaceae bacterium]